MRGEAATPLGVIETLMPNDEQAPTDWLTLLGRPMRPLRVYVSRDQTCLSPGMCRSTSVGFEVVGIRVFPALAAFAWPATLRPCVRPPSYRRSCLSVSRRLSFRVRAPSVPSAFVTFESPHAGVVVAQYSTRHLFAVFAFSDSLRANPPLVPLKQTMRCRRSARRPQAVAALFRGV
jgi:hypothetical protein